MHRWLEKVSDGSCYADNGQGGQSDLSASHEMLEEGRPQGNLLGDLLGRRKLLQQEVGAEAFYQGNGDEVADVEPVYGGPQDCSTSENDPDPRNEDEDSEDKNDNDEEPEYGNEDQAVAVAQYAHQDGVTVERNARLLNLDNSRLSKVKEEAAPRSTLKHTIHMMSATAEAAAELTTG